MNSYFNIFIISCVSSLHTCCCYITSLQFSLNWTESLIKSCVNRTELYWCSAVSCVYRISWLRFLYFICSVHELLGIHASMYAEKIENWEDFRINGALDHMTWILASDWLRGITWPKYWSLIGWEGSHDQDTGLWLAVWWPGPMVGDTMKIDRHGPGYLSPGQTLSREKWLTPLRARYYIMWHSCFISLWLEFMPQRGRTSICFDTQK